jgi:hypothetical protein
LLASEKRRKRKKSFFLSAKTRKTPKVKKIYITGKIFIAKL